MKTAPKMVEMAIILITVVAMFGPVFGLDTIASASAQTVSTEITPADPAVEIETNFPEANPGYEIAKVVQEAMKSLEPQANDFLIIPILGIVGVFIAPAVVAILCVWVVFSYLNKKQQMKHETIRQMVEKGVPIPENFPWNDDSSRQPVSMLGRGLKLIGIGIGLIIFFIVFGWTDLAGIGAIPLFIGLAYLLIWYLERKKPEAAA